MPLKFQPLLLGLDGSTAQRRNVSGIESVDSG
jgi:hypothetical protein